MTAALVITKPDPFDLKTAPVGLILGLVVAAWLFFDAGSAGAEDPAEAMALQRLKTRWAPRLKFLTAAAAFGGAAGLFKNADSTSLKGGIVVFLIVLGLGAVMLLTEKGRVLNEHDQSELNPFARGVGWPWPWWPWPQRRTGGAEGEAPSETGT